MFGVLVEKSRMNQYQQSAKLTLIKVVFRCQDAMLVRNNGSDRCCSRAKDVARDRRSLKYLKIIGMSFRTGGMSSSVRSKDRLELYHIHITLIIKKGFAFFTVTLHAVLLNS